MEEEFSRIGSSIRAEPVHFFNDLLATRDFEHAMASLRGCLGNGMATGAILRLAGDSARVQGEIPI